MPRTKVYPHPPNYDPWFNQSALPEPPRRIPESPMQALMEARPHDEPMESQAELQPRLEAARDAMDAVLTERERWIVEAIIWRRASLRTVGRELNLVHGYVDRIYKKALAKMAVYMTADDSPSERMDP